MHATPGDEFRPRHREVRPPARGRPADDRARRTPTGSRLKRRTNCPAPRLMTRATLCARRPRLIVPLYSTASLFADGDSPMTGARRGNQHAAVPRNIQPSLAKRRTALCRLHAGQRPAAQLFDDHRIVGPWRDRSTGRNPRFAEPQVGRRGHGARRTQLLMIYNVSNAAGSASRSRSQRRGRHLALDPPPRAGSPDADSTGRPISLPAPPAADGRCMPPTASSRR